ncbi:hypothetical protein ACSVC9_01705 [Clostridium sp. LBM24168]
MKELNTKYGILRGISGIDYYEDGSVKECTLSSLNRLNSSYGTLIPQYEDGGIRRKHIESLSFYKNGNLKSIYLQKQIEVNTSVGIVPAEFMTFYENGDIKRIFPLNGKITAYWTEEDEYNLAEEMEFDLSIGKLKQKVIGIYFYEGGPLKSITFWRGNNIKIHTPIGDVTLRIGVAFYPDGKIKSFEPGVNVNARTRIGTIKAYDTGAIGIHGDSNSLVFSRKGEVESLVTSTDRIEVTNRKTGEKQVYRPMLKQSIINENSMEIIPLNIEFKGDKVEFSNGFKHQFLYECKIDEYDFDIKTLSLNINSPCSSCTGCSN